MKKISVLLLFSLLCFGVGFFGYPYITPFFTSSWVRDRIYKKNIIPLAQIDPDKNNIETYPLADPDIARAMKMKEEVINKLDHNYDALVAGNKPYLETRKKIIDDYASGKKDIDTLRSFSYLSSLEGKWEDYDKATKELCKDPNICKKITTKVSLSGRVTDEKNQPIQGAKISVYGDKITGITTGPDGRYVISLSTTGPRKVRFQITHPNYALGTHTVDIVDPMYAVSGEQNFTKDFMLRSLYQEFLIDTQKKTITGQGGSVTKRGYEIVNPFTKYFIPFEAIRDASKKSYQGKVRAVVYEFDRTSANELLASDVFTDVHGYAAQGLVTFGMPLILFYNTDGNRLEVYKENPMQLWTTNRELSALVADNAMDKKALGFNPAEYEEALSPENVAKLIKEDEQKAYLESQKDPNGYPITYDWILKNESRLPGFWVYDQFAGLWENVGYSLVAPTTENAHSIHAPFWTKK